MPNLVRKEINQNIAILTLNRPEKRNALSPELARALSETLSDIEQNDAIKGVILTGSGKAFCSGADLQYLKNLSQFSAAENLTDSQNLSAVFQKLFQFPKITMAMVNGPALAGGCGLALCCDYIFADALFAKFGFTEVRIGFVPAIVMNILIRKIAPNKAAHLAISGDIIDAEAARQSGLVQQLAETENLKTTSINFLQRLFTQNSSEAMQQTKKLLQQLYDLPLSEGIKLAAETNAKSRKSADCQKGLSAFLNKEKIIW